MYDLVIVGAGPAGSTLARMAAGSGRILLVDKRPEPASYPYRICGGLLAPAAQRALAAQALGVPGHVTCGPQLFAVRAFDIGSGDEGLYQRHYLNVDRARFDAWLRSLVPDSVDQAHGWRFAGMDREGRTSVVLFDTPGGGRASVRTRVVAGADGAASAVRRTAFPASTAPQYVAIQGEFPAWGAEPHFGAAFDECLTDHYGWTVPKGERILAGIAVPAGCDALVAYERFIAAARRLGLVEGDEIVRGAAPLLRPSQPGHVVPGDDLVLLLGEAGGFISPSSAEGISYALRTGAVAASALSKAGIGPRGAASYRRAVRPLVLEVLAKVAKARMLGEPLVRRAIMRSGIGRLETGAAGCRVGRDVGYEGYCT
jgi:flavin-dependent dehydrogenase